MKYDTTMKEVLWRGAPALLEQLTGQPVLSPLQTEFPNTRNRHPDFLARLADQSLFHLEVQTDPQRLMHWRMLDYYPAISTSFDGQPVRQMVLALTDAAARAIQTSILHPNLNFSFEVRSAAHLDPAPLLASGHPDDQVLAILCRTDDIRQRVRDILERIAHLSRADRDDAITRLIILAGLRKAVPIVRKEVGEMDMQVNIQENEFLRDIFEKGTLEGEKRGREEGKVEGKAEGKAEMLVRLIERRFGQPVSDHVRRRIIEASAEQIETWFDRVFATSSVEEVFAGQPH